MENKPPFDRITLPPILIGVLSVFGIILVLLIGQFNANRPAVPAEDTATPFKYQLIGTEPGISTAETLEPGSSDGSSDSSSPGLVVTAQQGSNNSSSGSSTNNPSSEGTLSSSAQTASSATDPIIIINAGTRSATPPFGIIVRTLTSTRTPLATVTLTPSRTRLATQTNVSTDPTGTPTRTPTATNTLPTLVPLGPGTYDDSHPLLVHDGWISVTEIGAYQSTLHVSNVVGSRITFAFTGQQFRITFQGGESLGHVLINTGGLVFDLDQANGTDEYVSALLAQGTYTVTIEHISGGSVNIDSIIVPDFSTPTPTPTSTPTP